MSASEHRLRVRRTARYHTLGTVAVAREVWFVLHGHGQLSTYFIRHFAPLDDGTRYIIAPEALNKFYLEPTSWKGAGKARVGATWMTRDDRLTEIDDYVAYLDALYDAECGAIDRKAVKLVVLGFSQGVATAFRWAVQGHVRPDLLVTWAGPLPPEIDKASIAPIAGARFVRVLGNQDEMASAEVVDAETARFEALGLDAEFIRFDGGHEIDAGVLQKLG